MKKYFSFNTTYLLIIIFICLVSYLFFLNSNKKLRNNIYSKDREHVIISINKNTINALVSKTPEELAKGLSNTEPLKENEGMWFVFSESGYYPFWMKDMSYPIDIIWIDELYRVVYIQENATPDSYPNSFVSKKEAKYILEVKSGYVKAHDISVGEYVMIH